MNNHVHLKQFKPQNLLLDEAETRIVLKFIFKPADHELIDLLPVNDSLRGFAQALLVEAIDASYAIGFVEGLFRSTANPTKGAIKVLKSFGKKAAKHWFKHATVHDLMNVKVYQFVLDYLAVHFRKELVPYVSENNDKKVFCSVIAYKKPVHPHLEVWG